ncbi:NAC domain-containing 35 [Olea europaea subsp. europaea]|uniref:NAC domain-containing 35 n=1 Tax=Olea europaea subsp. europaea TaxID=158383 RepID=A0A8S0VEK7_OLEEU|nr:NAC domain-containing 35 [Olea europaea subsp. europaea]
MAIAAAMNNQDESKDEHEHDMVMPGFRFHPTEEELVEFYLRRKVEGKHFNVELITFLDLYRYDPWELPALAAIGEKEWYFYVPRDRKYRNGDRPNRVTTSGYWKATGADRMIRSENLRSIGLKKTLVFYSGKAPKGIRTSWIMNEYRLPHHETERLQKAEISLCRVYKRAGVEDHPSLPRSLPTRDSSSRGTQSSTPQKQHEMTSHAMERFQAYGLSSQQTDEKMSEASGSSSTADIGTSLDLSKHSSYNINPLIPMSTPNSIELEDRMMQLNQLKQTSSSLALNCSTLFASSSSHNAIDDLHKLVNYSQQASINHESDHQQYPNHVPDLLSHFSTLQSQQPQSLSLNMIPGSFQAALPDRVWDWNAIQEANKDYNLFK